MRIRGKAYALLSMTVYGAPLAGILLGSRGVRRLCVGGEADEAATDIDYSDEDYSTRIVQPPSTTSVLPVM